MEKVLIKGEMYLLGDNISMLKLPFLGLEIGTEIKSIGDLKSKSSFSRCDKFPVPFKYSGLFEIEDRKFLCIEIPKEFSKLQESLYRLYAIGSEELYISNVDNLTIRIYKPIFDLATVI